MRKLILGFGALLATGCSTGALDATPPTFAKHVVYAITVDCETSSCPYEGQRYVFVTRDAADAKRRLNEVAAEMTQANPTATNAVFATDQASRDWKGDKPIAAHSWVSGHTFSLYLDLSYL
jgi:hypothetical protein